MADYDDGGDKFIVVGNFLRGVHGDPSVHVDAHSPASLMEDFQNGYKKKVLDPYFKDLGYKVK